MYNLSYYGAKGVRMLKEATPKDTGRTADAWYYVVRDGGLQFANRNGPVVELMRTGYNNNGTWVPGHDFVTPILQSILKEIQEDRDRDAKEHARKHIRSYRRRLRS